MALEQPHRLEDQVVEIHGVVRLEVSFVFAVDPRRDVLNAFTASRERRLRRRDQAVFPQRDLVLHGIGRVVLAGVLAAQQFGKQRLAVFVIVQGKARTIADSLQVVAQDSETEGVEGRDQEFLAVSAVEQIADARFHLARGLVGEGHGDDIARGDAVIANEPDDLAGDDGGLAAAAPASTSRGH